ncbi:metallohydrolase [Pseudomonas aeruginosa]|uniref:metallohydrolase n=1 Tax=Pseudomonas aeruginosa TaxID=287 RepID=UPI000F6B18F2|nr:metallohydrolase [Pseudomonas aeruginosa]NRR47924.1 metallohydrolase [Pseudomonas aeruginosa]RNF58438.1 metallohydrolase [Pseudomonas aeruginosa]
MAAKITFFQVGNGDMALVRLADTSVTTILIDCNIRVAADNPDDDTPDVARALRKRLLKDGNLRPYVDVFLLSHPDQDHCRGLAKHFWLGKPDDYPDDNLPQEEKRILIRELWSSPLIFKRRSKNHTLCDDAKAFDKEARRRVEYWRTYRSAGSGNRILIMGEDINGKTDELLPIVIKSGEKFSRINGDECFGFFRAHLLAPAPHDEDADLEERLGKNESSVIMNIEISSAAYASAKTRFLVGGDAAVLIWERMWERFKDTPEVLEYDLLLAPHHCSWRTLSYDSWSEKKEDAELNEGARNALGQARNGATIIASSKEILDDDIDPPNIRARREYKDILSDVDGWFGCTGDLNDEAIMEFTVEADGKVKKAAVAAALAGATTTSVAAAVAPRAGSDK